VYRLLLSAPGKCLEGEWDPGNDASAICGKGYETSKWLREYGGLGSSPIESLILDEEVGYRRALIMVDLNSRVGGTIIVLGTEEQKKYIPGIASCDTYVCIEYTEPEASSDLFALRTSAREEDHCYLVNGQKMFTSSPHKAAYCWLVARTDPSA
jgi:hypothetical protein